MRRGLPVLLLAVILAYCRVMDAPFVYDDKLEVVGNRTIRILTEWSTVATYNFSRPLLILSYALNWWAAGLDSRLYHLTSLTIHLMNVVLAWTLAHRLLERPRAILATSLWALHPLLIEGVTYITGRSDALCSFFWLLALNGWSSSDRRGRVLAVLAVAGGLLTKEVAITLPLALLALEWAQHRRILWRDHRIFWALGGLAVLVRLGAYGLPVPEIPRPFYQQIGVEAVVWLHYLRLWLLPVGQSILHDYPDSLRWTALPSLLFWLALGREGWRRGGILLFGLALWILPLLPASLLPLKEMMAEHRTYLAGFGLCLGLAHLLPAWNPHSWPWRVAMSVPPLLLVATLLRNEVWRSELTLWRDAAQKNPQSAEATYGMGDALRMEGQWSEAQAAFKRVMELKPDYLDARINLGITLAEQGQLPEAEAEWKAALRQAPRSCSAHNNLGALALQREKPMEAMSEFQSTLSWCPEDPIAHLALGDLFYQFGDSKKAIWHYRHYLDAQPEGPGSRRASQRLRLMNL